MVGGDGCGRYALEPAEVSALRAGKNQPRNHHADGLWVYRSAKRGLHGVDGL
jgi:hypothetical protein